MSTKNGQITALGLCIGFIVVIILIGVFVDSRSAEGQSPMENVTVTLNVSNAPPELYLVTLNDLTNTLTDDLIQPVAGSTVEVLCNGSAGDPNGQDDIINATASIYASGKGTSFFDSDRRAQHYTNSSCTETHNVSFSATNNKSVICRFNVEYFAFNSTWECNMTVRDNGGSKPYPRTYLNSTNNGTAVMAELLALNLTTTRVDYGNLSVTDESDEKGINITNVGNIYTNLTVRAYGGNVSFTNLTDTNIGNTSMLCETGNITIGNERYSNKTGEAWDNMINVSFEAVVFGNVSLFNRTHETDPNAWAAMNETYWKIKVPLGVKGLCNGTIEFAATSAIGGYQI